MLEYEKEIICTEISQLSRNEKIQILNIFKTHCPEKIKEFADGTRINLDEIPSNIIILIYEKIKYILNEYT
jgi:tRNA(Ser,Leu) C12 N-acetylase TAN1